MRILVLEDETRITEQIERALNAASFSSDVCESIADAAVLMKSERFDALIADRMLPDGDAVTFIRGLRKQGSKVPILILTARDAIEERIDGLESGADDYLIKPFAMAELIARIRALLRRPEAVFGKTERVGQLTFDFQARVATIKGEVIPLPRHELLILECLLRNRGRVVSKEDLLDNVYGLEIPDSNTIPVHIHSLRRKFEALNAKIRIQTFRGLGYLLDVQ